MDPDVLRAMLKWPDVPACAGWLRLDRRGNWLVRMERVGADASPSGAPRFERVGNAAMRAFLSRHYAVDARGRWYCQNGPQKAYVGLDVTPWVFRLDDHAQGFLAHTGEPAGGVRELFIDEQGALVLRCALGAGVLLDRDLGAVLARLQGADGEPAEDLVARLPADGSPVQARLDGRLLPLSSASAADLPARLGYVAEPVPD
jgi:hypothetical protein